MHKALTSLCLAAAFAASGCASIVSKSQYPVTINSTPPGATVLIKNQKGLEMHKAQTPTTITLDAGAGYFSKARYTLEFQKDGYQNSTSTITAELDPWYFGNIIFGGLIGLALVDPITGAMWQVDDTLIAGLNPDPNAQPVAIPLAAPAAPVAATTTEPASAPAGDTATATPAAAAPVAVAAEAPPAVRSVADRLKELKALKDQGVVTTEEYEVKRAKLIEQL